MIITLELTEKDAEVFSEFLKRMGLSDYTAKARTTDEAYLMQDAGEKIRKTLAEYGFRQDN
ncbi:DUF7706 family protein [Desulforegula conservatrix]|uniref:DUF7706 family protein n=1 Tax=Desulforegula conservatrix TaxID=153026 RepID=UPI00042859DE|nr:hypothetical protein [Desulforegula conservatrix]